MGPSTLAPAGSYINTPKLIEIRGFKCIKPFNFIILYQYLLTLSDFFKKVNHLVKRLVTILIYAFPTL